MTKKWIEPTTYWLGNPKKNQAPARVRTHDLLAGKAKVNCASLHGVETKWSFGEICEKNAIKIMICLPHLCGRKITNGGKPDSGR